MKCVKSFFAIMAMAFLFFACKKSDSDYYFDEENPLFLSYDTIKFDTVFTTLGSTTDYIKIFNFSKKDLNISEVQLMGGTSSKFQININGVPASRLENFRIKAKDSIRVFVKVTIDPTEQENPFVVRDSIKFVTNGKIQYLQLEAYGQNARFIRNLTITGQEVWDKKLPYVVYNSLKIAEGASLTLAKGTRVYFHEDAKMQVAGTLKVLGEVKDSVTIASDRLERLYAEVPGQWSGIYFTKTSRNNIIRNATIKNALNGLVLDSLSGSAPALLLHNSVIKNMEVTGIQAANTSIYAFNNLFTNCGSYVFYGVKGGNYQFKQNTIANFSMYSARFTPSLFFSDAVGNSSTSLSVTLVNNIIWGNTSDELSIEKKGSAVTELIQNNFIRTKDKNFGTNNTINIDPMFFDTSRLNYRLKEASPAVNKGENLSGDAYYPDILIKDIRGVVRVFPSEIGCYEI